MIEPWGPRALSKRLALALVVFLFGFSTLRGQEPKYADEFYHSFKGGPANPPEFRLVGPDAEQCVRFEPEGLRITLPVGQPETRVSTGAATNFGIAGDFEITIGFVMLQEPEPKDAGPQTRFTLAVNLDKAKPNENQATLNRRVIAGGAARYFTWMSLWDEQAERKTKGDAFSLKEKAARFRLVRKGRDISFLVAEGNEPEFKLLNTYAYGAEDVREVIIVASTGSDMAALDVRVFDLRVKAAGFPKPGPAKIAQAPMVPDKNYAQDYFQPFKGAKPPGWEFEGPEAEECVRFEPAGLRITLPQGNVGTRKGTGLKSAFTVKGDFEITADFEMLKEPQPDEIGKSGTRWSIAIFKETPKTNVATISRAMGTKGESVFVTWQQMWSEPLEKQGPPRSNTYATQTKTGRLRLVRAGPNLYFAVAEGFDGEFQLKSKYPFGPEDLRDAALIGSTGGEKASLDVRVTNVRIRADAIPNMPAGGAAPPAPVAQGVAAKVVQGQSRGWLVAALLIGAALVLVAAVALGAGFLLLRGRGRGGQKTTAKKVGRHEPEA